MKSKKVVENISDVNSCNSSDNESDAKFEIVVDSYKEDKKPTKPTKPTKPIKPIKNKEKVITKDTPKKTLVEGDDFKKLQRKGKNLVPNLLIILIEKTINML